MHSMSSSEVLSLVDLRHSDKLDEWEDGEGTEPTERRERVLWGDWVGSTDRGHRQQGGRSSEVTE